jgi:hypothetical protein
MNLGKVEISRMITLSTSHITLADNNKLMANDSMLWGVGYNLTPPGEPIGYGFFIYCAEDIDPKNGGLGESDVQAMLDQGWSMAMIDIQKYAIEYQCEYIRLDPDGLVMEDLKTYDWET